MTWEKMVSRLKVSAPATIANLGPGFDVFGMALAEPFDVVEGRVSRERGVRVLRVEGVGAEGIPKDPMGNTASIAAARVMESLGVEGGLELSIEKGVRPGGGLGSSGAGAAAGAVIANELFGGGLSEGELIEMAGIAEGHISGGIHYDNVAPAILGGFTIVTSTDPLTCTRLEPPPMKIVVALPPIELRTGLGRQVLPPRVPLRDAVANVGRASTMVAALRDGDLRLFGSCMVDSIAEPARAHLVPGLREVERAAVEAGAFGSAMAGSGPAVFAVVGEGGDAERVARAMRGAFEGVGLRCETTITHPGGGVKVMMRE